MEMVHQRFTIYCYTIIIIIINVSFIVIVIIIIVLFSFSLLLVVIVWVIELLRVYYGINLQEYALQRSKIA